MPRILVTGGEGLIGSAVIRILRAGGYQALSYDVARCRAEDITDAGALRAAIAGCSGVIHLAGVSRVVWGEADPSECTRVNLFGTRNVLDAVTSGTGKRPWVVFGSSREVYGQAPLLPVTESTPHAPLNCYARTKAAAELLVAQAASSGVQTSIVRFSSVYGSTSDHADRVAPMFARLAARGGVLRVDGSLTALDFTHIDDVARALGQIVELLEHGVPLPTLHLVSGQQTRLTDLARSAVAYTGKGRVIVGSSRTYDVATFVGDPELAASVLGWRAKIGIESGMRRLIDAFSLAPHTAS